VILYDVKSRGGGSPTLRLRAILERSGTNRCMIAGDRMDKRPALAKATQAYEFPDSFEPGISPIEVDMIVSRRTKLQPRGPHHPRRRETCRDSITANGIIRRIIVRKVGIRFQDYSPAAALAEAAPVLAGLLRGALCCFVDVAPGA